MRLSNKPKPSIEGAFNAIIRYQLMLPVMLAAVLTMAAVSYMTGGTLRKQQQRFNVSLSYATETFIDYAAYELLPISFTLRNIDTEHGQQLLNSQNEFRGYFETVYLLSPEGTIEALVPFDERYLHFDMSRQDYYETINCDLDINISSTFSSLRTGVPTVYISTCMENGNIIVGELNLSSLQQATSMGVQQFPEIVVLVVDQDGTLIAHPDFSRVERQENIKDWQVVREGFKNTSTVSYYWREGTFWFGTTEKIEPVGWLIITEVPFWVVYGPSVGASVIMLSILILLFSFTVRNFSKQARNQVVIPLKQLSTLTDALAEGDYTKSLTMPRSAYELEEIEHLTVNFQNMSRSISSREKLLREGEKQYRGLVENSPDAIIIHDEARIIYTNDAARQLYKVSEHEKMTGKAMLEIIHPSSQPMAASRFKSIYHVEQTKVLPLAEQKHIRFDGAIFDAETLTSSIFFEGSYQAQTIVRDISRRKHEEERLKYLASHDYLTDLPNRFFFEEVLKHTIAKAKRTNTIGAILYLDLDQFKTINDSYGHAIGDTVLKEAAAKLKTTLRDEDIIARIGGDEFVILLDTLDEIGNAAQTAASIRAAFAQPFEFEEKRLTISFSIGIAIFPKDGDDAAELMQLADAAMYKAKDEGKNRAKFYARTMRAQTRERVQIISYLQYALEKNELSLVYQPQFAAHDEAAKLMGVEVLLRWRHPKLGMVRPDRFIALAEETGLILPIGEWVLESACRQLKAWQPIAPEDFQVAVNLSNLQLKQPNITTKIENILKKTQIDPTRLEIELLENIVFENPEQAINHLFRLKALGVRLAIDDFGTGYSMLGYLARFPFDHLKLDQRIAPNILRDPNESAIVSGIIAISQKLGINVIAEGIETKAQLDFYRSLGCNYFQGWHFSRAVSAETITEMLQNKNGN